MKLLQIACLFLASSTLYAQDKKEYIADSKGQYLAQPEEIKLSGNVRKENMASSIGRIELRWPRKVEILFGRTPQRAMADAARTASRALKSANFPTALQTLDMNWSVVFMDEDLPESQIPQTLISNCHPAWMTPPSNIYVVAQRVAAGCSAGKNPGTQVADSVLAQVLLHEIGHAVEYQLLGKMQGTDRMRAEGFATWFERYASQYSTVISRGSVKEQHYALARKAFQEVPYFAFRGSASDYAQASMFFSAIETRRGVKGIIEVYETMTQDRLTFFPALKKRLYWDEKRLMQEVKRVLGL